MSTPPDTELRRIDIPAAVSRGLASSGPEHRIMFTHAAIAAALAAEELQVGAYPLGFLARYIRAAGLAMALELPEPLIRPDQAELARGWMRAAHEAESAADRDDVFARWLEIVAALLALRLNTRLQR